MLSDALRCSPTPNATAGRGAARCEPASARIEGGRPTERHLFHDGARAVHQGSQSLHNRPLHDRRPTPQLEEVTSDASPPPNKSRAGAAQSGISWMLVRVPLIKKTRCNNHAQPASRPRPAAAYCLLPPLAAAVGVLAIGTLRACH